MTYPNFEKDSSTCANCGNALFNDGEFTNQSYLTIRDNLTLALTVQLHEESFELLGNVHENPELLEGTE